MVVENLLLRREEKLSMREGELKKNQDRLVEREERLLERGELLHTGEEDLRMMLMSLPLDVLADDPR